MSDILMGAAVDYALLRQWRVFACNGKHPLTAHGCLDATNDPDEVWAMWEKWPRANIGMATGYGIVVLDEDGVEGAVSLSGLESKHTPLPVTLAVRTGRADGGIHRYLAYAGSDISIGTGRVGAGLDHRGRGGYVILPPSIHPDTGKRYEWVNDLDPAPLPEWLRLAMLPPVSTSATPPASPRSSATDAMTRARAYLAKIAPPAKGCRNDAVFSAAGHLFAFGLSEGEVISLIAGFNLLANPPLGEREVVAAVRSAKVNGTESKRPKPKPDRPMNHRQIALRRKEVVYV